MADAEGLQDVGSVCVGLGVLRLPEAWSISSFGLTGREPLLSSPGITSVEGLERAHVVAGAALSSATAMPAHQQRYLHSWMIANGGLRSQGWMWYLLDGSSFVFVVTRGAALDC
jgi:hypothetical protein